MGTHLFNRHTIWTVFVSLLVALGLGACSDVSNAPAPVTPPSPDAKLSSLDINPGSLQPVFSGDTLGYVVDVAFNVSSVTVTAAPQNASATMTINGALTNAGQALPITLQPAGFSTGITIVVTAANGGQNSYVVTVNRALNNSLQNLTVSPGTLSPAFTASTTSYTVDVDSGVNSVTVTATLQDTNATMTINGQTTTSGQARTITPLSGPGLGTLVTIEVTAPNGSQKIYFVTVNRAALGGNNNLQSLTVSSGTLSPAFAAGTTSYTVDVASGVSSLTVAAQAQDVGASVSINGQATTSQSVNLNSPGLSTPISIVVTAPNSTTKTYTVLANRAALGGNNNLQSLTVSSGTLSPAFAAGTTSYTVDVASGVGSLTVAAQAQDAGASVTINGSPTTNLLITLNAPGLGTLITIAVTAPNGSQKIYFVTVNRAALGGNNNLQSLTVSSGTLSPAFAAGTTSYTVDVASGVGSLTVTAAAQDAGATVTINGQAGTSRSVTLNAAGQSTLVTIVVTAPNSTTKTYTALVNRAALGGNNNLQSLTVSSGTLSPAFAAGTTSYTVDVASGVGSLTVTAAAQDAGASVTINGSPTTSLLVTLNAPGASTLVTIVVTAPNSTTKTYTVLVNRAALGGNNNLQSLTVSSGTLTPVFNANTTSYTVDVASGVGSLTVTAAAQDAGATVSINGSTTTSLLVTLGAAGTATPVTIIVTAPNSNQKTYTMTVNRAALGGNNNLQSLTVSSGTLSPAFAAGTTSYTVDVASGVGSVTVTAQAQDAGATVSINGSTTTSLLVTLGAAGTATPVTIIVTAPDSTTKSYTVTVNRAAPSAPTITTTSPLPPGTVGVLYSTTLSATGGTGPGTYTWTLAGDSPNQIPSGLTLSPAGVLSGTPTVGPPTAVGTHSLKFTVTDTTPLSTSATFSLTIN